MGLLFRRDRDTSTIVVQPPVDFVVIAPMTEERDAVLACLPGYKRQPPSQNTIWVSYIAEVPAVFPDGSQVNYSVVVVSPVDIGQEDATSATVDAIREWQPRYVLLVGIAGGYVNADVGLGDILIAEQIVGYELAKVRARGTDIRWKVFRVDQRLVLASKNFGGADRYQAVAGKRPVRGQPKVHFGAVCSGNKVVARRAFADQLGRGWKKLIGFEMESAGCALACSQAATVPGFFMVRGVSDMADSKKDSGEVRCWRPYAASIAAAYAVEFLRSGPVPVREPKAAVTEVKNRFLNPPVMVAPNYFQGRFKETQLIGDFIKNASMRMMIVTGRGGVGKTAMVCRVLKSIESGYLPDHLGPLPVDGIVYLSQIGSHQISMSNFYGDLCRLVPLSSAARLESLYRDPMLSIRDKLYPLLECFQQKPVVVLLDNLDDLLDPQTRRVADADLREALQTLLEAPAHTVKILVTTRNVPADLPEPGHQQTLFLNEGLASADAKNTLRALDADGTVGLKNAPDDLLSKVWELTLGFPRALEAFYGILAADRSMTLPELLHQASQEVPDDVVKALVGDAFEHLEQSAQMVIQALAIYARPVPALAVDYLLKFEAKMGDCAALLNRLVNMHFVRKEPARYYLHPVDLAYALGRVSEGTPADRNKKAKFTQFALRHRAGDFFKQARLPRSQWKTLSDLEPQLAEFELRCAGKDYETAASLLNEIDADFLRRWGHYEVIIRCRSVLLGHLSDERMAADNLANMGKLNSIRGRFGEAVGLLRKSLRAVHHAGNTTRDRKNESTYLDYLATTYMDIARFKEAIKILDKAIALVRPIRERGAFRIKSICLGRRGVAKRCLGNVRSAIRDEEEALRIAKTHGLVDRIAVELQSLGTSYRDLGKFENAIDYYEKGLQLARKVNERRREAIALTFLSIVYSHLGDPDRLKEYSNQALAICREIGDIRHENICIGNLGFAAFTQGQMQEALQYFRQALLAARRMGDPRSISLALLGLGGTVLALGDVTEAIHALTEATEMGVPEVVFGTECVLGIAYVHSGDLTLARVAFTNARRLCSRLLRQEPRLFGPPYTLATALVGLAVCNPDWTRHTKRAGLLEPVLKQYQRAIANCPAGGVRLRVRRDLESLCKVRPNGLEPCLDVVGGL